MEKVHMNRDEKIIRQVMCWVETVVVGFGYCPFAGREVQRNSIHYQVNHEKEMQAHLESMIEECQQLDADPAIETTLLIFADAYKDFDEFLDFISISQALLEEQGYAGIYQLAHFHPEYCFADVEPDDASNYTNRSPYPILHIIRESSIEQALKNRDDAEKIPERNIRHSRELGSERMQEILDDCYRLPDNEE